MAVLVSSSSTTATSLVTDMLNRSLLHQTVRDDHYHHHYPHLRWQLPHFSTQLASTPDMARYASTGGPHIVASIETLFGDLSLL